MLLKSHHLYEFGAFRLNVEERVLAFEGEPVHVPPKAFELLALLVRHAGRIVTKDAVMAAVWADTFVEDGTVAVHLSTLRKLLGERGGRQWIETVPRRGYRFAGPVRELLVEAQEMPLVVVPGDTTGESSRPPPATADADDRAAGRSLPDALPAVETSGVETGHTTARSVRPTLLVWLTFGAAAVLALAAGLYLWHPWRRASPGGGMSIQSLVVMPFQALGADGREQYLQVGLPDALVARLGRLHRLRVLPTTSVKVQEDPFEAGRRLGVDGVVTGTVTTDGDQVRVNVVLSRTADRSTIWSGQFDRRSTTLIAVENEIAGAIADSAVSGMTAAERAGLRRRETPNGDAYVLYLRAVDQWSRRTPAAIRTAIAMYQRAIQLDPRFALAYAGLADAYAVTVSGLPPAERFPLAKAAAGRALALDGNLPEAHAALAFLDYKADWQWKDADREFRRALALDPGYALAHHWYGEFLGLLGRYDAAAAQMRTARALDPYSVAILIDYADVLRKAGRLADAQAMLEAGMKMAPDTPQLNKALGAVLGQEGHADEGVTLDLTSRRLAGEAPGEIAGLRRAFAHGGAAEYWTTYIQLLLDKKGRATALPFGVASELATLYSRLGDRANTMKWLIAATDRRENGPLELRSPDFAFLAGDPRFETLKKKVGLD
jgi:DNA-binding winged helix-turn-helix (wHTH) protein/TolB-like protein/tetratricopeptide (TPR) repeat protein